MKDKKAKEKKRPEKLIRQRQEDDLKVTVIRDGKVIIKNGELVKE